MKLLSGVVLVALTGCTVANVIEKEAASGYNDVQPEVDTEALYKGTTLSDLMARRDATTKEWGYVSGNPHYVCPPGTSSSRGLCATYCRKFIFWESHSDRTGTPCTTSSGRHGRCKGRFNCVS